MANISIKSQKITPFGGIFHVMENFDCYIGPVVDGELGLRCTTYGYQYSEIVRSLMSVYFCGGDCVEDVTSHLITVSSYSGNAAWTESRTCRRANTPTAAY